MILPDVMKILSSHRFNVSSEDILQAQIAEAFDAAGFNFKREYRLSGQDRIDFLVGDGIGVEVKVGGSPMAIHRQCKRYCTHDQIQSLILVTSRSMGLPEQIEGKDCYVHLLGRSWL